MSISNIAPFNSPITQSFKKGSVSKVAEIATEELMRSKINTKKNVSSFPIVLSMSQDQRLYDSLGYDEALPKQRSAINEYTKTANQQQRDEIIERMGFHFVV